MEFARKIIHCDCDCFYASIEIRDNPSLVNKPVAVGGSPERRGVIATCNYNARRFGIHSAMPSATARKRCPQLIIIRPDMDKYREASQQIHEIFRQYTDLIEPLSLDEAYLDVSKCRLQDGSATKIAEAIRSQIRTNIGITISAGIAPNKFLAKVASDWNKPDGQFAIKPQEVKTFVATLPVKKLLGVGKVTANKMKRLGVETCEDLRKLSVDELRIYFGSFGERLQQLSQGIDERSVQPKRIRKSISVENTYAEDLPDINACLVELPDLMSQLSQRIRKVSKEYSINKQFIKIKFHDFVQTTVEMVSPTTDLTNFSELCVKGFLRGNKPVRLLGIGVRVIPNNSQFNTEINDDQLSLITEELESNRQ